MYKYLLKIINIKAFPLLCILNIFSYNTFAQSVAIELEKMNVFYKSIDNPFKIVVQNYPCEKLILKSNFGEINIASDSCHYNYRTDTCNEYNEKIYIGVKVEDKMAKSFFEVLSEEK